MLGEPQSDGRVADRLLEQSEVGVLLDRLDGVESERPFSDDDALANHANGRVEVLVNLGAKAVYVLDEESLQLLLGIGGSLGLLERVLGDLVQLNLAEEVLRERVVDCGSAKSVSREAAGCVRKGVRTDAEVVVLARGLGVDTAEDLLAALEAVLHLLRAELDLTLAEGTLAGLEALVGDLTLQEASSRSVLARSSDKSKGAPCAQST